jgi:hypothetical protein
MDNFVVTHVYDKNYFNDVGLAFEPFFKMLFWKLRQLGYTDLADKMNNNKNQVREYLRKQHWTPTDLTAHEWRIDEYGSHVFGKVIDNDLVNTNGVSI